MNENDDNDDDDDGEINASLTARVTFCEGTNWLFIS